MSRLSEYAAITALVGPETFTVVDSAGVAGGTKKITAANVASALALLAPFAPSAWTAPTLAGAWVAFGGTVQAPQYRKIGDIVYLRGSVKTGTINTALFTLPVGFRPPTNGDVGFPVVSNGAFGWLSIIASTGVVTPAVGSNTRFDLNGIWFSTV